MATGNVNSKSQLKNIRIPHDVLEQIEVVKLDGESTAGFLVAAARGEIARRQTEGSGDNPLLSSLDALAQVEQIGTKAGEEIRQLVSVARNELQRRNGSKS
ncbi:YlcI/YnfO family protein [Erwinia psidii]|uniref:CopG family transcriptional regulator n=1 Tax=Erwinia psidii TaxID=69224 RepID=A0A3N6SB14_9GAMM|nr:YlcI/YnfO family protein [Erwinia psidii]MCX8958140.1 hypothetical protein [Erwinia psidii]RQM37123.1 hypothetical protein EB241_17135 [Erwinia psidii]